MRKILTAALTTTILVGSSVVAWSNISGSYDKWYIRHYGMAPHAAVAEVRELEQRLEVMAQYTASDLYARQVQRQIQIDEIRARCNVGRCSNYDRQALNNLMSQWQREQEILDSLRRKQTQQQNPYQYPYQQR